MSAVKVQQRRAFATIEEAIEDVRQGKVVVVVDAADRENEGDLTIAAQFATPEAVNFMTKEAPETYVYLVKLHGQERAFWKQVGELKRFQGAQQYKVSSEAASPGVQIAIYCAKCNKISGLAPLAPVRSAG